VWTKRPHSLSYPAMPIPHARRMNQIALALLVTALTILIAFHLLPFDPSLASTEGNHHRGWVIWEFIMPALSFERLLFSPNRGALMIASLPLSMLLVAASPFLIPLLSGSRPIWWITILLTSVCAAAVTWMVWELSVDPITRPPKSIGTYLASVYLNFLGLLFIRREAPAAPVVDS